jgi:ribonucleoside-triphosphate reductase
MCNAYTATKTEKENKSKAAQDYNIFLKFATDTAKNIRKKYIDMDTDPSVEDIQKDVQDALLSIPDYQDVAENYITYRIKRSFARKNTLDDVARDIVECSSDYWTNENSNKDAKLVTTQRDYLAGAISKDACKRYLLPEDIVEAHEKGLIHFHDADYFIQHLTNCCLINLEDMLQNGTVISKTLIEKPHRFSTACNIATQVIAQVASSQFGGQTITLSHLSPFIEETRKDIRTHFPNFNDEEVEALVKRDIEVGIQTLQYQILTLLTSNGQTPFITIFANLAEVPEGKERENLALVIEEVLKQRIKGVKNEKGVYITPAFPKIIYGLDECNIHDDSKYFYLTKLAAKCTANRMVPDYQSNKIQRQWKDGDIYPCMGCRSFLSKDETKKNYAHALNYNQHKGHKYYGRFNKGVVTINLPDVALSSKKDMKEFWRIFDERLELCHRALQCRYKRLAGTVSDVAPILWQYGAYARLKKGEKIDSLLKHGYSTISLGYAGLYECVKYMTGESHTTEKGKPFALKVMQHLNDCCDKWNKEEDLGYSVYGSPIESTTYKFARCLKKRFGIIKGITDHDYITNSFHVNVREDIDAFSKLKLEAEFQKLSQGGTISYVEVPDMHKNISAVIEMLRFIYDNIMYAELNCKFDYCQKCGYSGEIQIKGEPGSLYWECPNCGNTDQKTMNITRRT